MQPIKQTFQRLAGVAALGLLPLSAAQAVTVDLMVVYDDFTNRHFNGQVETAMRSWVTQVNGFYQNSQIDVQLRLVGVMQRNIAGSGMGEVLGNLRVDGAVLQKRNELGADYVTQLHQTGACGVGYVAVHKDWAFNVVGPGCGAQVLAHELGHTMGLTHSRRQGDQGGSRYRYGLGHGVNGVFATTMAYPGSFSTSWVPKFSNPRVSCNGLPCGVPAGQAEEADAAQAINNVRNEMAAFLPTRVGGGGGGTGQVSVHQHYNYGGYGASLAEGQYRLSDMQARGIQNDDLSSARVPAGWVLELFQHDNFTGTKTTYTSDNGGFPAGINDTASSLIVRKADTLANFANGVYTMKAKHSGRCADVAGASTADLATVLQWSCHGGNNQRWIFTSLGNGYFEVKAKHSNRCLDISGGQADNGMRLVQWGCHRANNQQWQVQRLADGSYRLTNRHSGRVADVSGVSVDNGAPLHQWDWVNGGNQQFWLDRVE